MKDELTPCKSSRFVWKVKRKQSRVSARACGARSVTEKDCSVLKGLAPVTADDGLPPGEVGGRT